MQPVWPVLVHCSKSSASRRPPAGQTPSLCVVKATLNGVGVLPSSAKHFRAVAAGGALGGSEVWNEVGNVKTKPTQPPSGQSRSAIAHLHTSWPFGDVVLLMSSHAPKPLFPSLFHWQYVLGKHLFSLAVLIFAA